MLNLKIHHNFSNDFLVATKINGEIRQIASSHYPIEIEIMSSRGGDINLNDGATLNFELGDSDLKFTNDSVGRFIYFDIPLDYQGEVLDLDEYMAIMLEDYTETK